MGYSWLIVVEHPDTCCNYRTKNNVNIRPVQHDLDQLCEKLQSVSAVKSTPLISDTENADSVYSVQTADVLLCSPKVLELFLGAADLTEHSCANSLLCT